MFEEPVGFLMKNEEDFTEFDRLKFQAIKYALSKMPRPLKRKMFFSIHAPYEVIGVLAGATEPTHEKTLEMSLEAVRGAGGGPVRHRHLRRCRTSRPTTSTAS